MAITTLQALDALSARCKAFGEISRGQFAGRNQNIWILRYLALAKECAVELEAECQEARKPYNAHMPKPEKQAA